MTVFVTGASGFLGGRLAQFLAEQGETVRALIRQETVPEHLRKPGIEPVIGTLLNVDALAKAAEGVSTIYHCAGLATDWAPWASFFETNVVGTRNMLRAAARVNGLRRFLHVSSTDVYGYPEKPCDETGALKDVGFGYNRSKILGEKEVREFSQREGLPVTIVRPSTIYGPRSPFFAVELAKLLEQGMMLYVRGGHTMGGFIYVDDVVRGMIAAAKEDTTLGKAYNLCPSTDASWRGFSEALASSLGCRKPWMSLPYSVAYGLAAAAEGVNTVFRIRSRPLLSRMAVLVFARGQNFPIQKASEDFGFSPMVSIEDGVWKTVRWLQETAGANLKPAK